MTTERIFTDVKNFCEIFHNRHTVRQFVCRRQHGKNKSTNQSKKFVKLRGKTFLLFEPGLTNVLTNYQKVYKYSIKS
jgi:hypothetical protein